MFSFLMGKVFPAKAACICTVLAIITIVAAACKIDDSEYESAGFIPVGAWEDGYGSGYNIDNNSIEYYSPDYGEDYPAMRLEGSIEKAVDFSANTGVLIIKITLIENMDHTPGKFTCVYYKDYTANHVLLANPIGPADESIEVDTVSNAVALFTSGNMGTHVSYWGSGYTR